jgi:uncharacterized protein YbjQ (UPF0145 family)
MPHFRDKSKGERERALESARQRAAAEAEVSVNALAAGGLPLSAERRLKELRDGRLASSYLSVGEYALVRAAGYAPLAQVVGSAIYYVGFTLVLGSREMPAPTNALTRARSLALGRLEQEADRVDADAVVGVRLTQRSYEWGSALGQGGAPESAASSLIEFRAVGTAVRRRGGRSPHTGARRILTNLSGQDLWKLERAGARPLGLVAGTSVFYASGAGRGWQLTARDNIEVAHFTNGLFRARGLAMNRLRSAAAQVSADGVVGVELVRESREVGHSAIFVVHVLGTAIAQTRAAPQVSFVPILDLGGSGARPRTL